MRGYLNQVIYADIVFLMNFCMDFLALFAAGKILGLNPGAGRLSLASAFGAVYCVFSFMYDGGDFIPGVIINIGVSVIMCFLAFNINSLIKFTKIFLIFYSACFMLGGGIEALSYLSGIVRSSTSGVYDNSGINNTPPVYAVIVFSGICVFIIIFAGSLFKRRAEITETKIIIGFAGREVKIDAIVDSGNLLYDPISSLPVIIVNLNSIVDLFDFNALEFFLYDSFSYLSRFPHFSAGNKTETLRSLKFRIIPVKSIAGANSVLPAFTPDYIKINRVNKNKNKSKKNKPARFSDINAVVAVDNRNAGKYNEK